VQRNTPELWLRAGLRVAFCTILLMAVAQQSEEHGKRGARLRRALAERSPVTVSREVLALTFRGSRAELELAAALRLQAALVLLFLAVRCVHLGQAGIDLALAGHSYTTEWLAVSLGAMCVVESIAVVAVALGARRLTTTVILADAAFGLIGLGVMALATTSGPGRAGSLNWMLPYTVATATFLGALTGGELVDRSPAEVSAGRRVEGASSGSAHRRVWPLLLALGLGGAYVASAYFPHRLGEDQPGQILGNAANYLVFFAAGALTVEVARRRVNAMAARNAEVTAAVAEVAREAQWRAVAVDVFGPVLALLDRVVGLADGEIPASVRREADRLIAMIDAVRPGEGASSLDERSEAQI
jgi:hypothetical protein